MLHTIIRSLLVALRIIKRPILTGCSMPTFPAPEELTEGRLVIVKDQGLEKWAVFRCPGGCGEKIMLTLLKDRRPHWGATLDWLGRPTLTPSIRQTNECQCHFFVRGGDVEWCADSGHKKRQCAPGIRSMT